MTVISPKHIERTRFLKFFAVGSFSSMIDFGMFNLLSTLLHVNPVVSSVISFCIPITGGFFLNRYWTYPESRSKPLGRQIGQFFLVYTVGLLIRTPIFALLESFFSSQFQIVAIGHNIALAIAVIMVMVWNFYANRYWTYNDVDTKS